MHIVRNIFWALLALIAIIFVFLNWNEAHPVIIWPGDEDSKILLDWPVGFISLVFFLLGMVPTWLLHRGVKWRLNRRIKTLENSVRASAVSAPVISTPPASAAVETPPAFSTETSISSGISSGTSSGTSTPKA